MKIEVEVADQVAAQEKGRLPVLWRDEDAAQRVEEERLSGEVARSPRSATGRASGARRDAGHPPERPLP